MNRLKIAFISSLLMVPAIASANLTGQWKSNDGGTYYIQQNGQNVFWYGERKLNNPQWANVFKGTRHGQNITGPWSDVPKGKSRNKGVLKLRAKHDDNVIVALSKTGGFGGSKWTRVGWQPPQVPQVNDHRVREDCVTFNVHNLAVKKLNGRWKVVDGNHALFDFGRKRGEALKTKAILKRYNANRSCFVGRPDPSLAYVLKNGTAPSGRMQNEDCIGFSTRNVHVKKINQRWKLVDGDHWLFDFGAKRGEALKSKRIIQKHGFNKSCFVGRPNSSFEYMRK
jgi:hypothetical protein